MISDFFIVIRYFVLSILFVGILQIEINGKSLESHSTQWFYSSTVPLHIRTAAKGGALVIQNSTQATKQFLKDIFGASSHAVDRASR